jgi:AcrR family transcriptional regulator
MGRPRLHSDDAILDAARELVLERGARATTIGAIARASGAPKGSVYHRYASVDDLLAAMWIRAARRAQDAFLNAVDTPDATAAAVAAALSLHDFAQRHPADARLLASMRAQDLVAGDVGDLNRPLRVVIAGLARRLYGSARASDVERTLCAVVDLPLGAVRRHLVAGSAPPRTLRRQLEAAVRAALRA